MQKKTFDEINQIYDLELDKIIDAVKNNKSKKVLLQLPEGMKPYAQEISDEIAEKTDCECFIWMDSCFGACDVPIETEKLGIDLIIQFGHSAWKFDKKEINVLD